ncbi:TPA: DNA alkylation repair protein [Streptococcus pneumoniae]|nr:DNA alkylation repair protein [Streptococcus pneumoniae]HEU4293842.1 DNA alkylation repair protein [Streptococcus pneumoniae]HEU5502404.1 DNA alkylation repair protein [Streptococcus pneumoniae]
MSLADLLEELEAAKDSKKARSMEAYMRHQFSFLGIAVPERNKLYKNIFQTLAGKRILENTNMWLLTI